MYWDPNDVGEADRYIDRSSYYIKEKTPKILWCLKPAKVSSIILLWISKIRIQMTNVVKVQHDRCGESATISRSLMLLKHSALMMRVCPVPLVVTSGERMDKDIMVFLRQPCFKHEFRQFRLQSRLLVRWNGNYQ